MLTLHWRTHGYLRIPRLLAFQLTQGLSTATCGLASWGLKTGYDQKAFLNITDVIGSGGALVAASGTAGLLCFAMVLFIMLRPRAPETLKSCRIKEALFGFSLVFLFATLVPATYIMANKGGVITKEGVPAAAILQLLSLQNIHLDYKYQTPVKAYCIVGWFCWLSTLISFILVSMEARHVLKHGPDGGILDMTSHSQPNMTEREREANHSPTATSVGKGADNFVEHA
ncbi:hypothetical protein BCR35DRAFT_302164 [Leucosporidium creatinivorum]|uniref:MARVEL domain-containing protein n=1 Tax=Leucosporidium creatinivorum TaxID=106004 RepID=A0A1Y2FTR3_9BASI|nr:hypothetical protein BCR35DRAFT_302164 [Leucosporidium creatinivorum]